MRIHNIYIQKMNISGFSACGLLAAALFALALLSGCEKKRGAEAAGAGRDGAPTLLWWLVGPQPTDLDGVIRQISEYSREKTGVRFEVKLAGWGGSPQRFQTVVNSGERFDLMFVDLLTYNTFVSLGAFADLTDLLPEYAPGLLEVIPPVLWEGVKIKGRVYAVPSYKDSSKTVYQMWDKSVADKYGIDIRETSFAALDAAFRAIKAGEGKRYYPFRMAKGTNNFIFDEYDALSSSLEAIGVRLSDGDMRVVCTLEQPDVLETYSYLRRWYTDGIINPDAFLIDEAPKRKPFMMAQGWPAAAPGWAAGEGVGEYVTSRYIGPLYTTDSIQGAMTAINVNSKYIPEALKFLELINTDRKFRDMLAWGIEGRHFEYIDSVTIRKLNDDWQMAAFEQGQFFNMSTTEEQRGAWAEVLEQNETARVSPLLGFTLDITSVRAEVANAKTVWEKYKNSLKTGAADPGPTLARCLAEMRKNGLDRVIAEAQRQVDAFMAARHAPPDTGEHE